MTNIILDKVKLVIKTSKPDGIVTRLRHNQELWPEILEFTESFEFKNKAEQVYFYSQQFTDKPLCKCGNSVSFVTITSGYREFCSRECDYAKNAALERRIAAMKSNGGVGLANPKSMAKAKVTLEDLHGYGVINPGQIKSHRENMRIVNPMKNPDVVISMRKDCIEQYGVDWHVKRDDVQKKISTTNMEKYGVVNPSQQFYSSETIEYFLNRDKMKELFDNNSVADMASKLNVCETTILNHLRLLDIRQPKEYIPEKQINDWLISCGFTDFIKTRKILPNGYELDFYSPSLKIAIEHCGLYRHSETQLSESRVFAKPYTPQNYHQTKYKLCKQLGIKLITIFEDEWLFNSDIVKNRLSHLLKNNSVSIGARSLTICKINSSKSVKFLNKFHIGGTAKSTVKYAAIDSNKNIRAVMTFLEGKRYRKSTHDYDWEMSRFATDGSNIPGIASKLFSFFIKDIKPNSVLSYADLRYGEGDYLKYLGFTRFDDTKPNNWFFSMKNADFKRYYRLQFSKSALIKKYPQLSNLTTTTNSKLTGYDLAKQVGLEQIWDCGNATWLWHSHDEMIL